MFNLNDRVVDRVTGHVTQIKMIKEDYNGRVLYTLESKFGPSNFVRARYENEITLLSNLEKLIYRIK